MHSVLLKTCHNLSVNFAPLPKPIYPTRPFFLSRNGRRSSRWDGKLDLFILSVQCVVLTKVRLYVISVLTADALWKLLVLFGKQAVMNPSCCLPLVEAPGKSIAYIEEFNESACNVMTRHRMTRNNVTVSANEGFFLKNCKLRVKYETDSIKSYGHWATTSDWTDIKPRCAGIRDHFGRVSIVHNTLFWQVSALSVTIRSSSVRPPCLLETCSIPQKSWCNRTWWIRKSGSERRFYRFGKRLCPPVKLLEPDSIIQYDWSSTRLFFSRSTQILISVSNLCPNTRQKRWKLTPPSKSWHRPSALVLTVWSICGSSKADTLLDSRNN